MKKKLSIILFVGFLVAAGGAALYYKSADTRKDSSAAASQTGDPAQVIDRWLGSMSLRDKVALLFIFHTSGTDPAHIRQFLTTFKPGGLILMGDNIPETNEALKDLTAQITAGTDFPPLLAIDEEGGTVKRIPSDTYAAGSDLARSPVNATTKAFEKRSALLASVGIPLNFGIIADTTDNTSSFIYPRILGTDPATSAERVAAAVRASKGKTYTTLKHFPGHGETDADSHSTIPTTSISIEEWRKRDKPPFQAGINAGADFVMIGHLKYSAIDNAPASLSAKWYDILRKELGFKGIIVTDDMFMLRGDPGYEDLAEDAVRALQAGATMVLFVTENGEGTAGMNPSALIDRVVSEVTAGHISKDSINTNARRVLEAQYIRS